MRTQGPGRWLAAVGAGLACAGCALTAQFPDMKARLDALPLPGSYVFIGESQGGTRPPFFGADPWVRRVYRSPHTLERTCDELERYFEKRRPTVARHGRGCTIGFKYRSGWRAWLHGIWRYTVIASAARLSADDSRMLDAEPPGAYTRVAVSLQDP